MSPSLYLLLVVISVTEVFADCKVCGSVGSKDQEATFCKNICAPDPNDCEADQNADACVWDKRKGKAKRCVKKDDTSKLCYFSDLPNDAVVGKECNADSKCAKSKHNCHQCSPCEGDDHDGKAISDCYLGRIGGKTQCVFNYEEDEEIKVDYCDAPTNGFVSTCVPGVPGNGMEYVYIEVPEGITWFDAMQLCLLNGAYLATILHESDIQDALPYIGFGASPWTGLRSTDPDLLFSPVDDTKCHVFHDGSPCLGCTERELWTNTRPIRRSNGGSMCVRLLPEEATINNDVGCDDKLYAVLCNCDNTAILPYTPPYTL